MKLSVIIPTYNEKDNIGPLLDILCCGGARSDMEIIIVDSAETSDDTLQKCATYNVISIKSKHASRALQLHEGAEKSCGDILYFVHADTRPPGNYRTLITESLERGSDFGMFSYQFDPTTKLLSINSSTTRKVGIFTGGGDQSLYIKRATYFDHGGFDTSLPIMEDFDFYWRLKKAKVPFEIIPEDVTVSARKYRKNSYLKVNWVNLVTMVGFKLGIAPMKLKSYYGRALN